MSMLKIQDIGKAFRAYRYEWQRIARWFGVPIKSCEENWVLRHVSFEVEVGMSIGIIGQNGAGKSTLLKMITGTLKPTEGRVFINGRIAAILELGMGFNQELSGRQNVFHTAILMGFNPEQIRHAMSDIEAFAEIGEYFDQPLRTYSSGMQIRIAFAVATAFRPEILIIDEALSVGDTYFQHKSFNRIREFQKKGTTLLIVSHERSAIQSLCERAILLDKGTILRDGNPEEVFDFYNAIIAEKEKNTVDVKKLQNGKAQTISGTGEARVEEIALFSSRGELTEFVSIGEIVLLKIKVKVYQSIKSLVLGYGIKDRLGQLMFGTNTWHTKQVIQTPKIGSEYQFVISFSANLGVGSYSVVVALHEKDTHLSKNYEWRDLALIFNVINTDHKFFSGCNWMNPGIKIVSL